MLQKGRAILPKVTQRSRCVVLVCLTLSSVCSPILPTTALAPSAWSLQATGLLMEAQRTGWPSILSCASTGKQVVRVIPQSKESLLGKRHPGSGPFRTWQPQGGQATPDECQATLPASAPLGYFGGTIPLQDKWGSVPQTHSRADGSMP